jgi:hypothetical protein
MHFPSSQNTLARWSNHLYLVAHKVLGLHEPELLKDIGDAWRGQRAAGVPINGVTARHILLAVVKTWRPELLEDNEGPPAFRGGLCVRSVSLKTSGDDEVNWVWGYSLCVRIRWTCAV